jgi:hypothetical protein
LTSIRGETAVGQHRQRQYPAALAVHEGRARGCGKLRLQLTRIEQPGILSLAVADLMDVLR